MKLSDVTVRFSFDVVYFDVTDSFLASILCTLNVTFRFNFDVVDF